MAIAQRLSATFLKAVRLRARLRQHLFSRLAAPAFAAFGRHSALEPPVRLDGEERIVIGDEVWVGAGSWLHTLGAGVLEIGDGCRIAGNCTLAAAAWVRLGSDVLLARGVYVADHAHAFEDPRFPVLAQGIDRVAPVEIGDGAWLGEHVVVCPGVRIGRGAVVGANSVVTADIPDRCVAAGAPARILRDLDIDLDNLAA
jgi:acetyltransferase-like isoleucine patch superfamily enzyme